MGSGGFEPRPDVLASLRASGQVLPPSRDKITLAPLADSDGLGRIRTTDFGLVKAAS